MEILPDRNSKVTHSSHDARIRYGYAIETEIVDGDSTSLRNNHFEYQTNVFGSRNETNKSVCTRPCVIDALS